MDLQHLLSGSPEEAAPQLLGSLLISNTEQGSVAIRLDEVEAYKGSDDPASHAFRGRTERNGSMFESPGTLYVYRSYGVHWCANVAAGPLGTGWGILFRGGRIVDGLRLAERRRGRSEQLANGPGKLTQALAISGDDNGIDLLDPDSRLRMEPGNRPELVMATPRIGISKAADRAWRFVSAASVSPTSVTPTS